MEEVISEEEDISDDDSDDEEFVPDFVKSKTHSQNRMDLKNLVRECLRWGVSPRAGAALANVAFID